MKRFGWSRPALLIGYFLAPRLEPKIYQASQVYGWTFFERPIVITLAILTVVSIWAAWKFSPNHGKEYEQAGPHGVGDKRPQLYFAFAILAFVATSFFNSLQYHPLGMIFPLSVSLIGLAMLVPLITSMIRKQTADAVLFDNERGVETNRSEYHYVGWIVGMLAMVAVVGFPFGCAFFIYYFITKNAGGSHIKNALMGVSAVTFLGIMSHFLTLRYPPGLLQSVVEMPWWLGG